MAFIVAPSQFEVQHAAQIFAGQAYIAEHNVAPDTPLWNMFVYRHDLNPARFDFYHRNVGLILERLDHHEPVHRYAKPTHWIGYMRTAPHEIQAPSLPFPPVCIPCVPVSPLSPLVTPEPAASTMLAMAMLMVGGWWWLTRERRVSGWAK